MPVSVNRSPLLTADRWKDYQLLDSGDGMKQERWGEYTLVRPDPQIIWPKQGGPWTNWDGFYHRSETGGGRWEFHKQVPDSWKISYGSLTFKIHPTSFKDTGLFPEHAVNWDWLSKKISEAKSSGREISVLNLFAYTGAATCAPAAARATLCHVDGAR